MAVKTISEYCDSINEVGQRYINDFIAFMNSNFSEIKPKISFSMPMWLLGTKMNQGYVAISAANKHFSIHFSNEDYVIEVMQLNPACKGGKRCINISYGDDQAYANVKQAVIRFIVENRKC